MSLNLHVRGEMEQYQQRETTKYIFIFIAQINSYEKNSSFFSFKPFIIISLLFLSSDILFSMVFTLYTLFESFRISRPNICLILFFSVQKPMSCCIHFARHAKNKVSTLSDFILSSITASINSSIRRDFFLYNCDFSLYNCDFSVQKT